MAGRPGPWISGCRSDSYRRLSALRRPAIRWMLLLQLRVNRIASFPAPIMNRSTDLQWVFIFSESGESCVAFTTPIDAIII